jgi:hypothetical protein
MGAVERWAKVALELVKRLPFHKLSASQTFDFICDCLMVATAIMFWRTAEAGPLANVIIALATIGFTWWSLDRNSLPIPPRTPASQRQRELRKPPRQLSE